MSAASDDKSSYSPVEAPCLEGRELANARGEGDSGEYLSCNPSQDHDNPGGDLPGGLAISTESPGAFPEPGLTLWDLYRTVQGLKRHSPALEAVLLHEADKNLVERLRAMAKPVEESGGGGYPLSPATVFGGVKLYIWDGTREQLDRLGFQEAPEPGNGILRYIGDPVGESG